MDNTGLILEGGGMRGAFTAGVLDFFHDESVKFPFVVGASAGACNGSSYISGQRGRNYKVIVEYGNHPEYISFKRALRSRELFGMDFLFDKLPNHLVPFDYLSFTKNTSEFVVGTTDIDTGEAVYYNSFHSKEELLKVIRASSSLPFLAPSVEYKGRNLMDGGIGDPIPIKPSIEVGNKKHIVVLTRNEGYKKKPMNFQWIFNRTYKQYPGLLKALKNRYRVYNETMRQLVEMEKQKKVLIIRPEHPLNVGRVERNQDKLHGLYIHGYEQAKKMYNRIQFFAC